MPEILSIPTDEIKFLIRRDRDQKEFAMLKEAIREIGVRQPLQVRDITSWKPNDRRRPDGGLYKWEALFGEGRVAAAQELYRETKDTSSSDSAHTIFICRLISLSMLRLNGVRSLSALIESEYAHTRKGNATKIKQTENKSCAYAHRPLESEHMKAGKSAVNLSLNTDLTNTVKSFLADNPRRGRKTLSELTESLWVSFLRKRGAKLPSAFLLKKGAR